jgi:hypothetical protein
MSKFKCQIINIKFFLLKDKSSPHCHPEHFSGSIGLNAEIEDPESSSGPGLA